MIQEAIVKLSEKKDLTEIEAENAMESIMEGKATTPQIKEFLLGLKSKGETIEEITACARIMRSKSIKIEPVGIGFLFAPKFHPAMKYAMDARRELGVRTIFNILGPLTNPAGAKSQLMGVFDQKLVSVMAKVLQKLGSRHSIIVNGSGLDEITLSGTTQAAEQMNGSIESYSIDPSDFGFESSPVDALKGGNPSDNARIIVDVLNGVKGPKRDVVVLNAAAALLACGLAKDFEGGIALANRSIDAGNAMKKLDELVKFSNS